MVVVAAGIVAGQVVKLTAHPHADLVRLAYVDLGDGGGPVQIVFGGPPVVTVDSLVAVAPPGARLESLRTKKMRRRRYRGEYSHGMLCSLDELGWAKGGPDEVAILQNVKPGMSLDGLSPDQRERIVKSPSLARYRSVSESPCVMPDIVGLVTFTSSRVCSTQPDMPMPAGALAP